MKTYQGALKNEEGLHARPAATLAKVAMQFKSDIFMYKNNDKSKTYNPKSVLSLLSMGAAKGDNIILEIQGTDEAEAYEALKALIENGLQA